MTSELVDGFNALPQGKGASGVWHFDLRYIPLEPHPHHVLVGLQAHGEVAHVERLPVDLPGDSSGIEYFPESAKDAAPEIAYAVLHIFMNKLKTANSAKAPSKLTMHDHELCAAVGDELQSLGVRPTSLTKITTSNPRTTEIANTRFASMFEKLKAEAGYTGAEAAIIPTPTPIWLPRTFAIHRSLAELNPGPFQEHLNYSMLRMNTAVPPTKVPADPRGALGCTLALVEKVPVHVAQADADAGNPFDAFDCALRLHVGLGVARHRAWAWHYAVLAATHPDAPHELRAAAHGLLLQMLVDTAAPGQRLDSRHIYAAAHHANAATLACRAAQPLGVATPRASSSVVLYFMKNTFTEYVGAAPELRLFCTAGMEAMDATEKQIAEGKAKMLAKRLKAPLRYRCAAVGCGIEADKGKMLAQCAGKCDADKKPSYCSKACQRGDWANHKPFCRPGAECSVIDDSDAASESDANKFNSSASALLQAPIALNDGTTSYVSSSTLGARALKGIRDIAEKNQTYLAPDALAFLNNVSIERY